MRLILFSNETKKVADETRQSLFHKAEHSRENSENLQINLCMFFFVNEDVNVIILFNLHDLLDNHGKEEEKATR